MSRLGFLLVPWALRERVLAQRSEGSKAGVNSTPTFFINGVRHDGSYDLRSLLVAVEEVVGQ